MDWNIGQITLADLVSSIKRKDIIINRDYQRQPQIWPISARSYFIETILEGYPFPKISLYQTYDKNSKRPVKELIDGQQRVSAIVDFYDNKFRLSSENSEYKNRFYSDLPDELQRKFDLAQVESTTILVAERYQLLEMFNRINAYTSPLNAAEKRHSKYQGEFKWFIVRMSQELSPILSGYGIISQKLMARMGDSEFLADLVVALELGVVSKTSSFLDSIYKKYDKAFDKKSQYSALISEFFELLRNELSPLVGSYLMKSYTIHSLFTAFAILKGELLGTKIRYKNDGNFRVDEEAVSILRELSEAHEAQIETGPMKSYVASCLSSTTKGPQRKIRVQYLVKAFQGQRYDPTEDPQ